MVPSVQIPVQRYTGAWSISRSPHSPQSNFNRKKRIIVSCLSEFCRHSHAFHEKCTHQGSNSHTMFAQKLFLRLSRGCTLYRRVPGRYECPNFPLAETGWLPLAKTDLSLLRRPGCDLEPTWDRISATRASQMTTKCSLESWKRRGQHSDTFRTRLTSFWGDFLAFSPRGNENAPREKPPSPPLTTKAKQNEGAKQLEFRNSHAEQRFNER